MASHEDLSIVLIQSTLVITNGWHVLDDNSVIWVLARGVENAVGLNHVIDDVGLGNLLGAELLVRAEILSIIVTQVVVAGNGGEFDTSVDQEVDECGLHLCLARLEVITSDESTMLLGKCNCTRNESVLRRAIDEWDTLEDGGNGKDGGWSNLLVTFLDSLQEIFGSIVNTIDELSETLSVGSPLDNDLVQVVVGLEVTVVLLVGK